MLLAALTLACSSLLTPPQDTSPTAQTQLVEVTYLANSGFLLRSGTNSILIDAFVPREVSGFEALDAGTRKNLLNGLAPFQRPMISLVSHAHPDHFKAPFAHQALFGNDNLMFIGSEQVVEAIAKAGKQWSTIIHRTAAFRRTADKLPEPLVDRVKDFSVLFLDLPHVKGSEADLENLGHLVRLGNFKFLHLGDAAPNLAALQAFKLAEREIDVAFVPYWFYSSEEGIRSIDEAIKARFVVVYHIPTKEKSSFTAQLKESNPNAIVFSESLERKIFEVQKRKSGTATQSR